ncbi:PEP-CTERM sorting domain-containing protein [Poriferisphaera sp. WC338]|uniref:PEP-CTERM sorting domain-containing protein n=1 Tax=Poriferisphaera sp. WC338 TaxID=3425129 RepID=UPI003D814E9F
MLRTNKMMNRAAATVALLSVTAFTGQAMADAFNFVAPDGWSVGDVNTTYQDWGTFTTKTGNLPNLGSSVNPSITSAATVDVTGGGFVAGSGNFYSFSSDHGFIADIYNHGGSSGTGGLSVGSGTHVIVQTSSTLNGSAGVYASTLEIVDHAGNTIAGGNNASALRHNVIFEGIVPSTFGDVMQREEIWEFYLPNYVGDFRVQADVIVHSSFDQLRVDSAIADSAFAITAIPEPASLALLGLGGLIAGLRRRQK